jgi:hypothetical protein
LDTFRRAILPALVVIVLLAALVFRLSSCASDAKTSGASPAANPSAAQSSAEASPLAGDQSPTPPYSAKEIKSIYENLGLSVIEIRDAGDLTMVHYYKQTGVPGEIISRFDWFDKETGTRELVYGWAYTDKFEIKADKSFSALTTGLSQINGSMSFPEIYRSGYEDIDGAVKLTGGPEKYYAPLDHSCTVGTDRRECLTDININPGFVSFGFGPLPGYESDFYAAYASIPKMDIKNEGGFTTITLYKTVLAKGAEDFSVKENPYCSFSSMTVDGENLIIKLMLSDSVSRYNLSTELSPESGLPYAVLEFTNLDYDYPAGW